MTRIEAVKALEILDSRGNVTVEVKVQPRYRAVAFHRSGEEELGATAVFQGEKGFYGLGEV